MRQIGWGFKAISAICLSHLHADHVAGLPGLLLTIGNTGRREPLTIVGPPETRLAVAGLRVVAPYLDRKSTRLNSSHANISYAVFCLKKKKICNSCEIGSSHVCTQVQP